MPYGLKRGVKAPGDYGFTDLIGLGLAGATGIIAALVTDYQQQGEASALYTINRWVINASNILGFGDVPLWAVVLGLIGLGAGSIFYFQPITRQGAFAQGFGLLAVIMTAVPGDLAGSLETLRGLDELPELQPAALQRGAGEPAAGVQHAALSINEGRVYQVQQRTTAAVYELHLSINFEGGLPDDVDTMIRQGTIRGRLHNAQSGETFNLFRAAGGALERQGDTLIIHAGVPARASDATLHIRIECAGYRIEEQSRAVSLGESVDWRVDLQKSNVPLFIQRLRKSYWF